MKVILLKDVKGVGRRYEEKEVSDGYANNFLLPMKYAVSASAASASQVKALKEGEEAKRAKGLAETNAAIARVAGTTVELSVAADEKGHLFQKINKEKLAKHVNVAPEFVVLENPIKELGTFTVPMLTGEGKETSFTLVVHPVR